MIAAQELRIGNWVHHLPTWSYRNESQTEFDFQFEENDWWAIGECSLNLESITPIPLTEEWLLKFGFVDDADGFFTLQVGRKCFRISSKEGYHVVFQHDIGLRWAPLHEGLEYVYQLQNLYHALTGKELQLQAAEESKR